jgi:site-specific DNA recombinase
MSSERAVLYARVSGDDHDEASKLDAQIGMCREYAGKQGYTILHEFREDKYSSGADLDLPHLNEVLELARAGGFDVLVCRELDRLARDLAKQLFIEDELKRSGVRIEYALERYDDSPEGGLMKHVRASVAEYERMKIRQRTKRGKRNSVKAGNVTCNGLPPYGYRETTVDGKRTLIVHEEEAVVVRTIFQLYLRGNGKGKQFGVGGIAQHLTERNIPSPSDRGNTIGNKVVSGYGHWWHQGVGRILQAPVYRGEWQYGKRTDNPITILVPRIISNEEWEAAQVIRKKNRRVRKHPGDYDFLLSGAAHCSECGKRMQLRSIRISEKPPFYYYTHPKKPHTGNGHSCAGQGYYRAEDVDKLLWGYASEILSDPAILADAFKEYGERLQSGDSPTRAKLEAAEKRAANAERRLSRLLDLYLDDAISKRQYAARKKPLDIQLEKESEDVGALSQELEQFTKPEEHMVSITRFAETAAAGLGKDVGIDHRREVVRRLGLQAEFAKRGRQKYADAVFCFADDVTVQERDTYSCVEVNTSMGQSVKRPRRSVFGLPLLLIIGRQLAAQRAILAIA